LKVILSLLLCFSLSFGFTSYQKSIIRQSYNIGKLIKAKDGMTFENSLASIVFTESSGGKYIVGDRFSKHLRDASLGPFQIRIKTAKWIIKKDKFCNKYFGWLLKDEDALITYLLTKPKFSTILAGTYLKIYYNIALKRGYQNPWQYAISKYNGGSKNYKYINRVRGNIKLLRRKKII
jgi:hypothetical protein